MKLTLTHVAAAELIVAAGRSDGAPLPLTLQSRSTEPRVTHMPVARQTPSNEAISSLSRRRFDVETIMKGLDSFGSSNCLGGRCWKPTSALLDPTPQLQVDGALQYRNLAGKIKTYTAPEADVSAVVRAKLARTAGHGQSQRLSEPRDSVQVMRQAQEIWQSVSPRKAIGSY